MYEEQNNLYYKQSVEPDERQVAGYMAKVMGWMCVGLFTTLVAALLCISSPAFYYFFLTSNAIYAIFFVQLAVVAALSLAVNRLSAGAATVLFLLYAALTGITFSTLFFLFELSSLIYVFGITAIIFVGLSVYGFVTHRDLTRVGTLAIFGLMGIIVAGIFNMFLRSSAMNFAVLCIGIVIFLVLTAYDTQKIKGIYIQASMQGYDEFSPELRKVAILGALTLYLDFINLFLKLLMLLGRRRN